MRQFRLLSQAAKEAGVSRDTLRGYCLQGLLAPEKDSSGRRLFEQTDIDRAAAIYQRHRHRRGKHAM